MPHHRLFVALHLPAPARRHLIAVMGGVAGARWQADAQLHCTIRFLGECDGHRAEDIAQALAALRSPAFDAETERLGTFDRRGTIDTLWIEIGPVSALRALHDRVDRRLAGIGVAPDPRAYRPHVTLARFGRSAAPPLDLAERLPSPPRLTFRFEEVRLFESLLGPDGAHYETVARYRLG